MGKSHLPMNGEEKPPPHKWGGPEISAHPAPSPAFGGYFPINGEEPSPMNGEERSAGLELCPLGRSAVAVDLGAELSPARLALVRVHEVHRRGREPHPHHPAREPGSHEHH